MTGWQIFRIPLALAFVSLVGLLAALLYEGPIDLLWDALIAVPLAVIVYHWLNRRRA